MRRPWWTLPRTDYRRYMNRGRAYWTLYGVVWWVRATTTGACRCCGLKGGEHRHVANAALNALAEHPEVLSALAGVPHPGVEELAEVIDPAAFDPRRLDVGTAYERGRRQRAALDAAGRVRALLGHTTTDTDQETPDAR